MKRIINFDRELEDFSETAAAIENLDLVISVDTAAAASCRGHGQTGLDPPAVRSGLALAIGKGRQPLVPDHAALSPTCTRRLGLRFR